MSPPERLAWGRAGTYLLPRLGAYNRFMKDYLNLTTPHTSHGVIHSVQALTLPNRSLYVKFSNTGGWPASYYLHFARTPFLQGRVTGPIIPGAFPAVIITEPLPPGLWWYDIRAFVNAEKTAESGLYRHVIS